MKLGIKRIFLAIAVLSMSTSALASYSVSQTTIKHVQIGSANAFYISVTGDTSVSGCTATPGWLKMDLAGAGLKEKEIISFALAAQMSGTPVDVGSDVMGCVGGYADINFIRVGNPD